MWQQTQTLSAHTNAVFSKYKNTDQNLSSLAQWKFWLATILAQELEAPLHNYSSQYLARIFKIKCGVPETRCIPLKLGAQAQQSPPQCHCTKVSDYVRL